MSQYLHSAIICSVALAASTALSGCKASASFNANSGAESPEPAAESPAPSEDPSDVHIEGDHLTIDQMIHFETDSDVITDDSTEILDHIAQALNNHPEIGTLQVIGHTDANGEDDHNQDLSERRAASVVVALEGRGVKQKMDSEGVGETKHLCEEDTEECHEKNRRVEFVVAKAE